MKKILYLLLLCGFSNLGISQADQVSIRNDANGSVLLVNGKPFMINGMNWDYIPIGTNTVNANFWMQPDEIIRAGLDSEMSLLKNMGVNVIRQYTGVPAKWIEYIYENYGIYTMLNHSFGRYGLTIDGAWVAITDYSAPKTQALLMEEVTTLAEEYKDVKGILLYLLGNENNYGLFWAGAETEEFPDDDQEKAYIGEKRGRPMYKLMNDAAVAMKAIDRSKPVAICNGDVLFIDIIAEECKDIDIYGTNTYRGVSFGDMFQVVKEKLDIPLVFTEFGADAYNAVDNAEDQEAQAYYMVGNWKEIYANAAGLGKVGNSIGGFTFQFSDGWWKYGFNDREGEDVHDVVANWPNGGYYLDFIEGENNMNEEWFGVCAKGPTDTRGLYDLYPRAAYYALKEAHQFEPYAMNANFGVLEEHFSNIQIMEAVLKARGDHAALKAQQNSKIRVSNLMAKFETFSTGGSLITTPNSPDPNSNATPDELGFDHMQSYFVGIEGNPSPNMSASVNFNILGNVAENPINEIFYENRGIPVEVVTADGDVIRTNPNRVQVYNADYEWNAKYADVHGFYRTGHYHWQYEGDFFGLYPEANYGPNLDIYQGEISGVEVEGKRAFKNFTAAFGPQLWWGANPAVLLKYSKTVKNIDFTAVYHEDIDDAPEAVTSIAIPLPKTRRVTLHGKTKLGNFEVELGGIWAGQPLNGRTFQVVKGDGPENYEVFVDKINNSDNWGGKFKIAYSKGVFNWYAQGAAMGVVANGGADATQTFTGWTLRDSGSGNQYNFLTGISFRVGDFEIAPNFLWQRPIIGAIPNDAPAPGRLRNIQADPFAVRVNRETTAGELLFAYDPTPATWLYAWDNDRAEDASFAFVTNFVYRHLPTTMDAAIGFLRNRTSFAFPNSTPAVDLWESNTRVISKLNSNFGIIGNFYFGNGQANGSDERVIQRGGGDIRLIYKDLKVINGFKVNDWGPFDYHRDFNLTYPLQLVLDISTAIGKPDWFLLPNTQVGIRGTWRSLNEFSPRYLPTQTASVFETTTLLSPVGFENGSEWEIRPYIHINIGR